MEPSLNEWASSVYYVEARVKCSLARAWAAMLDYTSWNPSFAGSEIIRIRGNAGSEGEIVLIRKQAVYMDGNLLPEFYAETAKVVPLKHIVWCVYPKGAATFRNFVDFGLAEEPGAEVLFTIDYYEQNRLSGEALVAHRKEYEESLQVLAAAFVRYCER